LLAAATRLRLLSNSSCYRGRNVTSGAFSVLKHPRNKILKNHVECTVTYNTFSNNRINIRFRLTETGRHLQPTDRSLPGLGPKRILMHLQPRKRNGYSNKNLKIHGGPSPPLFCLSFTFPSLSSSSPPCTPLLALDVGPLYSS